MYNFHFQFLKSPTAEAELSLFKELFHGGLFVVPGCVQLVEEIGWFRLTISHPIETLKIGILQLIIHITICLYCKKDIPHRNLYN